MKRRIFMLLMAVVMMLGMNFSSMADEVKYYEGSGNYTIRYNNEGGFYEGQIQVSATFEDGIVKGSFIAGNGDVVEVWSDINYEWFDVVDESSPIGTRINDISAEYISGGCSKNDGTIQWNSKGGAWDAINDRPRIEYYFEFTLYEVDVPTEPNLYQISTGFTGTAVSDRGDYNLYIAGYFSKGLTNGTHALVLNDITSQTIAVVAHNNANGVNRNMNQSTIEEMTVTVSGGVMTEMIIRGRVQTDGGTLDRYTATINP